MACCACFAAAGALVWFLIGYFTGYSIGFVAMGVGALAGVGMQIGQKGYSKLWDSISRLNAHLGKASRGHLEEIICHDRPYLTQYQSRFELLPAQTGALFFLGDRLTGVELAPSAEYFKDVWFPLVCFCYGAAALELQKPDAPKPQPVPFQAASLTDLRRKLSELREIRLNRVRQWLAATPVEQFRQQEEERYLELKLTTALGVNFAGQYVEDNGELVYLSLAARPQPDEEAR